MDKENLQHDVFVAESTLTGLCAVTVVKVDRTCIAVLEACEKYPLDHMLSILNTEKLANTVCFYSTAFFIESNYRALLEMAQFANTNNRIFSFNLAAEYVYDVSQEEILEMI
jgi:hypothetical protein